MEKNDSKNINNNIEQGRISFNEKKNIIENLLKNKQINDISNINKNKEKIKEEQLPLKDNNKNNNNQTNEFDIIDENDILEIEKIEQELNDDDFDLDGPLSKSDTNLDQIKINLWEIIPINYSIKKNNKKGVIKNLVSTIVYNGINLNDKFNETTNKPIIIFDKIQNNKDNKLFKKIQKNFIYMSYRTGLVNTKFLPGGKNDYTSDCGWGCMLRCCQMMLSRGFIKKKIYELKELNNNTDKQPINLVNIKKELIFLFYDKFIELQNIPNNEQIAEIYVKLLKEKYEVAEMIAPYSIYVLTLLGNCPNVFTSDYKMISCFIKINKTLFNDFIKMIHFKEGFVNKNKLFQTFCNKIENEEKEIPKENYIEYKSDKYIFNKGGIIFISLRLGLHKVESNYIEMIPKLFNNLHNNIGFVSGKKKRAFYFIGMNGDKLIFADPHLNQNLEEDENNFPTYSVNELYLTDIKELSSELTVGIGIFCKEDLELFLLDLEWFKQICPGFIGYKD